MVGLDAYNLFLGFNLHFDKNNPYDVLKYGGKLRTKEETFKRNKHRWQFSALESACNDRKELWTLYYLCFSYYGFKRVKEPFLIRYVNPVPAKLEQFKSLKNQISTELKEIKNVYGLYDFEDGNSLYPKVFEMYENKKLCLETLLILDKLHHQFLLVGNSRDILTWPETVDKFKKAQQILLYIL